MRLGFASPRNLQFLVFLFMLLSQVLVAVFAAGASARSIAPHAPLIGRTDEEIEASARSYPGGGPQPLPPPIKDTCVKLVYDAAHPFMKPTKGQMRGPCPGMNTLANHGYLPRSGIATPQQIITASEEGKFYCPGVAVCASDIIAKAFGMGNDIASFVTFAGMLVRP
ncbi:hypothetical protein EXIGLDRAFT_775354 [Exidia glandulosa HHB12029]|uniref:Heme haloperoxidase family profile domain-containing protein n=1 Tax=Exidia glandulosa HHB12029 TaxID=1314781 RepID=A0A165DXY1_EXIGL|nr:hypothetical protein EXIGLDRAFT_775354 [Exidia glandulosa HHB12029]